MIFFDVFSKVGQSNMTLSNSFSINFCVTQKQIAKLKFIQKEKLFRYWIDSKPPNRRNIRQN